MIASNGSTQRRNTVHANIGIYEKISWLRNGPAGLGIIGPDDPDALRRADFGTDATGSAADFLLALDLIINEKRHIAEFLGNRQFFLGILHGKYAARIFA